MIKSHANVVLFVLLAAGCGKIVDANLAVDAGPGDAAVDDAAVVDPCDGAIDVADFTQCFTEAFCEMSVRCAQWNGTAMECVDYLSTVHGEGGIVFIEVIMGVIANSQQAGALTYDPAAAAATLAAFADTCELDIEDAGFYGQFVAGHIGDGEACFFDFECDNQGSCENIGGGKGLCRLGACRLPVAIDAECGGLTEDNCSADDHCVVVVHGQPLMTCTAGEAGNRCTSAYQCDDELWCSGFAPPILGQCQPDLDPGSTCWTSAQCAGGLRCNGAGLTANTEDNPLGVCGTIPALGEDCHGSCGSGLQCFGDDGDNLGKCVAAGQAGDDCTVNSECNYLANLYCGPADKCAELPALDQPCPDDRCATGLTCYGGACKEPQPAGANCSDEDHCASLFCDQEVGKCAEWPLCYPVN